MQNETNLKWEVLLSQTELNLLQCLIVIYELQIQNEKMHMDIISSGEIITDLIGQKFQIMQYDK